MNADNDTFADLFNQQTLDDLFPTERADQFFDALLGDPAEGAYDIRLAYEGYDAGRLHFNMELHQRPGKCLACNLTYGLPNVFARHPIINIQGVVDRINSLMDGKARCVGWKLGNTKERSRELHEVPLVIDVEL